MSGFSILQSSLQARIKSRSMGVKLIVVCGLALLMTIPALFVGGLAEDRTKRATDVVKEISGHVGGQQIFLGPTRASPYNHSPRSPVDCGKHGIDMLFPSRCSGPVQAVPTQA